MFYVYENIPCRALHIDSIFNDQEVIILEFTLKNRNLLCVDYSPVANKPLPIIRGAQILSQSHL